jgi:hypothetical protein
MLPWRPQCRRCGLRAVARGNGERSSRAHSWLSAQTNRWPRLKQQQQQQQQPIGGKGQRPAQRPTLRRPSEGITACGRGAEWRAAQGPRRQQPAPTNGGSGTGQLAYLNRPIPIPLPKAAARQENRRAGAWASGVHMARCCGHPIWPNPPCGCGVGRAGRTRGGHDLKASDAGDAWDGGSAQGRLPLRAPQKIWPAAGAGLGPRACLARALRHAAARRRIVLGGCGGRAAGGALQSRARHNQAEVGGVPQPGYVCVCVWQERPWCGRRPAPARRGGVGLPQPIGRP